MAEIVATLEQDHLNAFLQENSLVLVDFWAAWCGPCKMISPVVDDVAKGLQGKVAVGKLNVDEFPEIAATYQIINVPTLILFVKGKERRRVMGYHGAKELMDLIQKNI